MIRAQFDQLFEEFKTTRLFLDMINTVEDSPWHREANVGVHTEMVVDQYLKHVEEHRDFADFWHGAVACVFHDVGKPIVEEVKESESRGVYRSYASHELMSARVCENYLLTHTSIDAEDILKIVWMIQNHLPYKTKKPNKVQAIVDTAHYLGVSDQFAEFLVADQAGRISDEHDKNMDGVFEWVAEFKKQQPMFWTVNVEAPTVTLLIGPSSAGKSTLTRELILDNAETEYYSWDQMRLEWYTSEGEFDNPRDEYSAAFDRSCYDKEFMNKTQAAYMDKVKRGVNIVVDNTNLSAKRRRFFVSEAVKKGYRVNAIVCMIQRDELLRRSNQRPDRDIPDGVIINMHESMAYPNITAECHNLIARKT